MHAVPVRPTPCPEGLAACFAAGEYADLLRAMVLAHKEHGTFSLAGPLGRVLAVAAARAVTRADDGPGAGALAAVRRADAGPRPGAPGRARSRRSVARRRAAGAGRAAPRESGRFADQAGLDSGQRAANLSGSMRVRARAREGLARTRLPLSMLVCDDILTTGATAREAQRALEVAGVRVRAVVTVAATRKRVHSGPMALPLSGPAD